MNKVIKLFKYYKSNKKANEIKIKTELKNYEYDTFERERINLLGKIYILITLRSKI